MVLKSSLSRLPSSISNYLWYILHLDYVSAASFIPVSRIAGRAAVAETVLEFDYSKGKVKVAVPLLKN